MCNKYINFKSSLFYKNSNLLLLKRITNSRYLKRNFPILTFFSTQNHVTFKCQSTSAINFTWLPYFLYMYCNDNNNFDVKRTLFQCVLILFGNCILKYRDHANSSSFSSTMAKTIKNFTRKAELTRNRVLKHREKRKFTLAYQRAVDAEINRRNQHADDQNIHSSGDSNTSAAHHDEDNECPYEKDKNDFSERIKCWAIQHCITKRALNDLLSILIVFGFQFLPKDSRTFLQTPKTVDIRELSIGHLWYYGLQNCLKIIFQNIKRNISINLDFNFDGVELFKSSRKCFWPIITSIRGKCRCKCANNCACTFKFKSSWYSNE